MSEGTVVRWFKSGNDIFSHKIFCDDDDRIELQKQGNEVILTYDNTLNVFNADKNKIGDISIKRDNGFDCWVFEASDKSETIVGGPTRKVESHIDLEVEVSKWYLSQLEATKVKGESDATQSI